MTAPTDAQWSAMTKLVQSFLQRADAEPFRVAVDWKGLGLYDYPQIIKKPMDLGTVKKKIADRKYKTILAAADDVRLVWTNCMTYNADGSDFFNLAKGLSKKWEEKLSKAANDHGFDLGTGTTSTTSTAAAPAAAATGAAAPAEATTTAATTAAAAAATSGNTKVSLDDKRNFARSLYKISKEDLGKVIVEIDTKCPQALIKNAAEDECELNVDKLTPTLFQELKLFVHSCGVGGVAPTNAAAATKHSANSSSTAAGAPSSSSASATGGSSKKKRQKT